MARRERKQLRSLRGELERFIDKGVEKNLDVTLPRFDQASALPTTTNARQKKFLDYLHGRFPWRMRRIENDLRWLRREAERRGFPPDEVKWII